jgi:predicted ArsR family transcriptional regulator
MDERNAQPVDAALYQRTRSEIAKLLADLKRPVRTDELAERLRLHPNGVRLHLERLRRAGVVERLTVSGGRGRPRYEWALAPDPVAGLAAPTGYRDLARWLVRNTATNPRALARIERDGIEIGRQIGDDTAAAVARPAPPAAFRAAIAALGFQPAQTDKPDGNTRYTLRNCPYRDAAAENQAVVCTLHRGVTRGVLERLSPEAEVAGFEPNDPHRAGCVIDVSWRSSQAQVGVAAPESTA